MKRTLAFALALCVTGPAAADEGMWTFDNVPADRIKAAFGFAPSQAFLDRVRMGSVRVGRGCSGSFISPEGLVMTNHHCARDCIANLSNAKKDFVKDGFYARTAGEEKVCPGLEVVRLVQMSDVTARVQGVGKGKSGADYSKAQKAEMSRIEKECSTSDAVRCDVVTLYQGGQYQLYKYQRFQDVRLVFAPEEAAAFFGGDPDNFDFPRYDLDVSLLRVYDNGKPLSVPEYYPWSPNGAKDGQLTFTAGTPGATSRLQTAPELEVERDLELPMRLFWLSELRGILTEYQQRSPEAARHAQDDLFGVENSLKARKGMLQALMQSDVLGARNRELESLRKKLGGNKDALKDIDAAMATIRERQTRVRGILVPYLYLEGGRRGPLGFYSDLFSQARMLLRASEELPKPSDQRLREFGDANLPSLKQRAAQAAPIYADLEVETLTFSLTKLREALGNDDPAVKAALGSSTPREVATRTVRGSKLADPKLRLKMLEGGKAAVDAANDPMIALARAVDPMSRAIRATYESEIEGPMAIASEAVARARFAAFGTSVYPDATGTLRLSFGQVKGWTEPGGEVVPPFTDFNGAFAHATGKPPYDLPPSWIKAKPRIRGDVSLNFVTTNDIIGGNSGSPVFDQEGRIVGLIFDGNLHSLGGDYFFDPKLNRAVAVSSAGLLEALDSIYGAKRILDELKPHKQM